MYPAVFKVELGEANLLPFTTSWIKQILQCSVLKGWASSKTYFHILIFTIHDSDFYAYFLFFLLVRPEYNFLSPDGMSTSNNVTLKKMNFRSDIRQNDFFEK